MLPENLGDNVNFIKIDVQGAEEMVMKGATRLLQKARPMVAMELEPARLRNMGAEPMRLLRLFDNWGYSSRSIETDIGLAPDAALEEIASAAEKVGVLNVLFIPPGLNDHRGH